MNAHGYLPSQEPAHPFAPSPANRRSRIVFWKSFLASVLFALSLGASLRAADRFNSVYLSEFLADNQRGLRDDDGDRSGWIELHNGSIAMVNLGGWFLTDDPANLMKWRFPSVGLLPDKSMVVFASAKNRTKDLAHLHTNFRLDKKGSYLALVNAATNVVSEFAAATQSADVSDGRLRGQPGIRVHFMRPTPGRHNADSGAGFAPEPIFSKAGGNFTEPFSVELSSGAVGAKIRYTLDGTMPTGASPIYAAPLQITNTTSLRARTFQDGLLPGPPHSEVYLQLNTNVTGFHSTLPLLIMDTLGRDVPVSSQGSLVHLSFHEPVNGMTSLTNRPTLTTRAAFHVRGSTSAGMPQQGFAVKLIDEFNEEKNRPVLGLPSESDWILYAPNFYEPVMIHNPFIHQLSRDLGRYSPRTRFVEVYLTTSSGPVRDAHYYGIYVLEEKIKIGRNRVDIDRLGAEDLKPPAVTGGYLLKFDRLGPGEGGFWAGGAPMVYAEPREMAINLPQRAPQRQYLNKFFDDFERALNGPKWRDPVAGYPAYVDVEAAIDYHVLEVLSGNVDANAFSTFFHKPRNGKIIFGPHWDYDRALGSQDRRDAYPRRWNTGRFFGGPWWPQLFSDPDFWQRWVDRWQELRRTHFSEAHLHGLIDQLAGELREAQPRQVQRWDLQPRGGSYQSEIGMMKNWLSSRVDFIDRQLVQPPRLSSAGGNVAPGFLLTLEAATNATVYYTLDGSDPRASQGGISTNAMVYTKSIQLKTSTRLVTRAHDPNQRQIGGPPVSTPWSGPMKTNYVIAPP